MKKYLFLIVALMGITLTSCEKDLDIKQKMVLSSEEYYANATPEQAVNLIAAVYRSYYSSIKGTFPFIFLECLSDDIYAGAQTFTDSAQFQDPSNLNVTPNNMCLRSEYSAIYQVIYRCNLILERIPDSNDPTIQRVKAEANFFRALCMFEAVRWWGTPPFVTKVATPDEYYPANGNPAEIIPWCMERMQEAADVLPALSGKGQQRAFGARITKHAALAFKGKIGVWYGQKFNDQTILKQGRDALKQVIDSNLYGLINDMFLLHRPGADFSEEYIFEHNAEETSSFPTAQADNRHVWMNWRAEHITIPDEMNNYGWGFGAPSKEFGDFLKAHEGGIEKPRFKSTIHTYEQVLDMTYEESTLTPPGVYFAGGCPNIQGYFRFRQMQFKEDLMNVGTMNPMNQLSGANLPFMRYPEVLLLYAEAQFLLNGDSDGSGLAALNQVRNRAQIAPLATMTYQDIKDERRAELFFEQERYFDIVRWGDAPTLLKDKGKYWYTFYGYEPGTTNWKIDVRPGPSVGWQDKYQLMPFPTAQIAANPNLVQNPGW